MKKTLILIIVLAFMACKENKSSSELPVNAEIQTLEYDLQGFNQIVPDTVDGGEMLLGRIDRSALEQDLFKDWYEVSYTDHRMDTVLVDSIKPLLSGVSFKIFMGSWCEDSQREVPALFKILDYADFDTSNIELIAVDHDKITPQDYEADHNIEYIPSIMLMKDGEEIKRIVEYPVGTLEQDLLAILQGKEYKHYYED
ncbi:thioredoxin family protein [Aureitalea marina]|uniref:Uncharacterized protein n=1 Tax=Aureitalea marina TaxID=930804 RepID=A0A2S7KMC3_9FLAO|nr:thioredoxin family protein [Aureitalea marina]PQB03740.1 hypothetical protein BST85_01595 [Aureitalea marina]